MYERAVFTNLCCFEFLESAAGEGEDELSLRAVVALASLAELADVRAFKKAPLCDAFKFSTCCFNFLFSFFSSKT